MASLLKPQTGPRVPRYKGSGLLVFGKGLAQVRGERVVEETLRRVRPELSDGIRLGGILSGGWYPLAWLSDLHRAAAEVTGEHRGLAREIGRATTQILFTGIYRILTYVLSPESIVSRVQGGYSSFFDTGKAEILLAKPGLVRAELTGCEGYDAWLWDDLLGSAEALVTMAGGKDVRTRILAGGGNQTNILVEYTWH